MGTEETIHQLYRERARLIAYLTTQCPAVVSCCDTDNPDWPVVYVSTRIGQMSWHISRDDMDLFAHLEEVGPDDPRAAWDGHSTDEKYRRLEELVAIEAMS